MVNAPKLAECVWPGSSDRQPQHLARRAGLGLWRERCAHQKYLCRSEIRKKGGVLMVDGKRNARAVVAHLQPRTQIILALVVGGEIAAQHNALAPMMNH